MAGQFTTSKLRDPINIGAITEELDPSLVEKSTTAAMDIYVAGNGSDSETGTQTTPLRTLAEAERRIPGIVRHRVTIHLQNETYLLPESGTWLRGRSPAGGYIEALGDEAWDSTVMTAHVTGTAQSGTDQTKVVLETTTTANNYRGYTIEMTSGSASGQRRLILENTTTDAMFAGWYISGVASGDTYKITEIAGPRLAIPASFPQFSSYTLSVGMGSSSNITFRTSVFPSTPASAVPQNCTILSNVRLGTETGSDGMVMKIGGEACLYGIHMESTLNGMLGTGGSAVAAGWGPASPFGGNAPYSNWGCWGIATELGSFSPEDSTGRYTGTEVLVGSASAGLFGNRQGRVTLFGSMDCRPNARNGPASTQYYGISGYSPPSVIAHGSADWYDWRFSLGVDVPSQIEWRGIDMRSHNGFHMDGPGCRLLIKDLADCTFVNASATSSIGVLRYGAKVFIDGDPSLASGSNTWKVDGTSYAINALLTSVGDSIQGADGSGIWRVG